MDSKNREVDSKYEKVDSILSKVDSKIPKVDSIFVEVDSKHRLMWLTGYLAATKSNEQPPFWRW
ncbi:hypothetical protein [Fictibacillus sp. 18YEL24]|uniref:hypothetical protein n=1 Tax=Fictibacillus sp. 18YEL24 TaxID=2745875 RepID=UPI0018CF24BA|nr:hypothetical protein [Fictibacillus sp. 18YEL24]MBH0171641.1 hypothetical protein [Fictibacillus sp. 18YEL24]